MLHTATGAEKCHQRQQQVVRLSLKSEFCLWSESVCVCVNMLVVFLLSSHLETDIQNISLSENNLT